MGVSRSIGTSVVGMIGRGVRFVRYAFSLCSVCFHMHFYFFMIYGSGFMLMGVHTVSVYVQGGFAAVVLPVSVRLGVVLGVGGFSMYIHGA